MVYAIPGDARRDLSCRHRAIGRRALFLERSVEIWLAGPYFERRRDGGELR